MTYFQPNPGAASSYTKAKGEAISALKTMRNAMRLMGAEHLNFHNHYDDVSKRLQEMKRAYGGEELDVEVIRSIALDTYLSDGNLPKVTALGHFEMERALKTFQLQEKELDEIHKKTARLVETLLGDRRCKCGDGHGSRV